MNVSSLIAKIHESLKALAEDGTAASGAVDMVGVLTNVHERLGALIQAAGGNGGSLPAGSEAELKTLAGTILTGIGAMVTANMEAAPAAEDTEMSEKSDKSFDTQEEVALWCMEQLTLSASDTDAESVAARYSSIAQVAAASVAKNWEAPGSIPLKVQVWSAHVGTPGKPMDLTVRAEQSDTKMKLTGKLAKAQADLLAALGKGVDGAATTAVEPPAKVEPAKTEAVAAVVETAKTETVVTPPVEVWPMDMAGAERDEDGARVKAKKRAPKAAPVKEDLSWGADPFAVRGK